MNVHALGLTSTQKAFRRNVIGGSDANIIMSGDDAAILRLWREKRGELEPENLDDVLAVIMGQWTEELNRRWFTKQTGRVVTSAGEERLSIDHPFMASTVDGLTDEESIIFEAKHVGGFQKDQEVLAKYMPQLHHNMHVFGVSGAVLSIFSGNSKWAHYDVSLDRTYLAALIKAEEAFWNAVQTGEPPVKIADVKTPQQLAAARFVKLDLSMSEDFGALASEWLECQPMAKRLEKVEKSIKEYLDSDVVEAVGHGITVTVDRANRFRIKASK